MTARIIIGLTGYAGAGKDTVAQEIVYLLAGTHCIAFADALREEAAQAFGVDSATFTNRALKEAPLHELRPARCIDRQFALRLLGSRLATDPLSPRYVMQRWGDYRRDQAPYYWVAKAREALGRLPDDAPVVITDVRFENEASWLRSLGGRLWRITRPGLAPALNHRSDCSVDLLQPDLEIANDGSEAELARKVSNAVAAAVAGAGA